MVGCCTGVPRSQKNADPHTTLGMGLRKCPRGVRFLMSEVPLYLARAAELGLRQEGARRLQLLSLALSLSLLNPEHFRLQGYLAHKKLPPPRTLQ